MKYDLLTFKNSILGKAFINLPISYGYQMDIRPGSYDEFIKYEYEMDGDIVMKRIDYYLFNDTVRYKNILNYTYN